MTIIQRPLNPYDWQGEVKDPRQFAGRRNELDEIMSEARRLGSPAQPTVCVAVVGPRRVGKSSLLLRVIENCSESGPLAVRIDLDEGLVADAWAFWREVLGAVRSSIPISESLEARHETDDAYESAVSRGARTLGLRVDDHAEREKSPGRVPNDLLLADVEELQKSVVGRGRPGVLLLVDEAQWLHGNATLRSQLRRLRDSSRIGIAFFGQQKLSELFSDQRSEFYNQAHVVRLENFSSLPDVSECALLPLEPSLRVLIDPLTIDYLVKLSRGKPNQIRLICHAIYKRFEKGIQQDLSISLEALQETLNLIRDDYSEEERALFEKIKDMESVDLEILHTLTEFPNWPLTQIANLDESFRGEAFSEAALNRRIAGLNAKGKTFVSAGLVTKESDVLSLKGDEYHALFFRFWYELKRYDRIQKRLQIGEGVPSPFSAKVKKLIRAIQYQVRQKIQFVRNFFDDADQSHEQFMVNVRKRFKLVDALSMSEAFSTAEPSVLTDVLTLCWYMPSQKNYSVLCFTVRDLMNPRQAVHAEIYFETDAKVQMPDSKEILAFRDQASQARLLVEGVETLSAVVPSLHTILNKQKAGLFEEMLRNLPMVSRWELESVERFVNLSQGTELPEQTTDDRKELDNGDTRYKWYELYDKDEKEKAINTICETLPKTKSRLMQRYHQKVCK